jgi:hypothetical protein
LETLSNPSDIRVWAKAQLIGDNADAAVQGYQKVLSKTKLTPCEDSAKLKLEYATALFKAGKAHRLIREELLGALDLAYQSNQKLVAGEIILTLLYVCLYAPPPQGFSFVIRYADEYLAHPNSTKLGAGFYINLACAYGQKASWQIDTLGGDVEQAAYKEARRQCLIYVQKATAESSSAKQTLRRLWDKNDKNKNPEDNDLEIFFDDEEFANLLAS